MTSNKLFLHASNVHQGGGRSLLDALLRAINGEFFLSVDARMPLSMDIVKSAQVRRVKPSAVHRFITEIWLKRSVAFEDIVLCFGKPTAPLFGHLKSWHHDFHRWISSRSSVNNTSTFDSEAGAPNVFCAGTTQTTNGLGMILWHGVNHQSDLPTEFFV